MPVAIDLAPTLKLQGREDDSEDDAGIWPSPSKPRLVPSLWQGFPLDLLLQSVLVRLPFPVLLKFRSVSRSWREWLTSHDFWLLWFQGISNPHHNPNPNSGSYTVDRPNPDHVLDSIISSCDAKANNQRVPCLLLCSTLPKGSETARWLSRSAIRFVQDGAAIRRHPQYWSQLPESFMGVQGPYVLLASDGGLLLLATRSKQTQKIIVCNPLLSRCKVIRTAIAPFVVDMASTAVGFIVDKSCGVYRVFLFGKISLIYSSNTGQWRLIPTLLREDAEDALPPMLEGSYFWLFNEPNSSGENIVFAYHADAHTVTGMRTLFPETVSFPRDSYTKCGYVWKDSSGLHTLASTFSKTCVWKLDNGRWVYEKRLPLNLGDYVLAGDYVKVDDLLLLGLLNSKQVYVFNCELEQGCWTPYFSDAEYLTGYCVFRPSCIRV